MRRFGLFGLAGFLLVVCGAAVGQQFRISDYDGENITIEYPPSFDGAYLFVEQSSNLTSNVVWEAVDYTEVNLVLGDTVFYSPPATNTSGTSTNQAEVPYVITPEYLEAVTSGEIENNAWTAGSVWDATTDGVKGFFRIFGLSFVDTDGDGVDNVSEYGAGTDPNVSDAPPISLPPDDGDPQIVPGSVASAPGDWNTPQQSDYRAAVGLHGAINARILAMDGTNGTFTATSMVAEFGAWIEAKCGTWTAPDGDDTYPTVENGRFFRTETNGFAWAGKENIYALAFHPHDGSEEFSNHLTQSAAADPAGLALLPDSTPVLVNASSPWSSEKIEACLPHLVTVSCHLQRLSGGIHDPDDTPVMAQAFLGKHDSSPSPLGNLVMSPYYVIKVGYRYDEDDGWILSPPWVQSSDAYIVFLDDLEQMGFGQTLHSGYMRMEPPHDWIQVCSTCWDKFSLQSVLPDITEPEIIYKTFNCETGGVAWLAGGDTELWSHPLAPAYGVPPFTPSIDNTFAVHASGIDADFAEVLSTFSPPPLSEATLVMDFDRDGTIGTNDLDRVDESHPFRFWTNEDGNSATYAEADLEDFFPAQISWTEGAGISNLTFKLSANVDLDYIQTTMTTNDTDAYLTDLTVAGTLSGGSIQSLSSGTQTGTAFAEGTILLLASSTANITAEIYVHILENGSETLVSTNHFSFSPVADMYRTKNLRAGGTSTTEAPNWPDELTNGKDFVFIHGFNVSEAAGRDWNADIFKRLWHSGSNARFNGVLWDGSPNSLGDKKHYHHSVIHAFATAPNFAIYLNGLTEPVVMAHSLGNMVTGLAICDHAASVEQYYALDSAVALESYGDVTPNSNMVPDSLFATHDAGLFIFTGYRWNEYPFESWASEWYRLFPSGDTRAELTWRHRLATIQDLTDVFNFYSSTEDVLRVDDEIGLADLLVKGFVMKIIPSGFNSNTPYAWQIQEMYKGLDQIPWINAPAGGISKYGGWGFVKGDSQHIEPRFAGLLGHAPVKPHFVLESVDPASPGRTNYLASLQSDPLFRQEPEELFQSGALAFASGTVGTHGGNLEYNVGDNGMDISAVPIRDWLLAKAFPARTRPMGSTQNGEWDAQTGNFDMPTTYMTDPGIWIRTDKYNGTFEWRHSDFRDVPYVYIYKLYEKITTKEN